MRLLKKLTLIVAVGSFVFGGFSADAATDKKNKGDKEENIEALNSAFEKAVNTRHFDSAKESVNKMLLLMKKEMKESKKMLSSWDKGNVESDMDKSTFAKQMKTNNDVYVSIKKLVDSSPAALRVKGKQAITILNNYKSLVNR